MFGEAAKAQVHLPALEANVVEPAVSSINRGVLIVHSLGSHLLWLGQETPNPEFLSQAY